MLSVNSPSSPSYSKDTFFVNNFENTEHKEQTQMRNNLSPDVQSKEPNGLKESLSRSKSEASGGKITSPSRTRKKTWGEKLTKKFKMIGSSSESPVSEYTCWNGEEPFDDRLPRRINHNVAPHNIHKNIGPCDSAILNRY
uniref:Uncharacterized protein n=1 Tax=Ciona savignyi TaxID=51511 RepID=H2ZJM9_CIOSA